MEIDKEMVSVTLGQSFLAGIIIGSERKSPSKENCPFITEALSLDSQRVMDPTIFPFQPRDLRTFTDPCPGPSVVMAFRRGREKFSPAAKPRPFNVVCFPFGIIGQVLAETKYNISAKPKYNFLIELKLN